MPGADATIVIPARYGSTRLPGKPLVEIAGRSLLARVVDVARRGAALAGDAAVSVATDDPRIADHAATLDVAVVMTDPGITSGSGRALAACAAAPPAIIVNLQGDAPFTAPAVIAGLIALMRDAAVPVATVVTPLDWAELDAFREHKRTSPSSGTTCVVDPAGRALWFSKAIIPAIREEAVARRASALSPILRHVGLYAYTPDALSQFEAATPSRYEACEGLEQLRFLELGIPVATFAALAGPYPIGGIDTPADVALAEALIARLGDPLDA